MKLLKYDTLVLKPLQDLDNLNNKKEASEKIVNIFKKLISFYNLYILTRMIFLTFLFLIIFAIDFPGIITNTLFFYISSDFWLKNTKWLFWVIYLFLLIIYVLIPSYKICLLKKWLKFFNEFYLDNKIVKLSIKIKSIQSLIFSCYSNQFSHQAIQNIRIAYWYISTLGILPNFGRIWIPLELKNNLFEHLKMFVYTKETNIV